MGGGINWSAYEDLLSALERVAPPAGLTPVYTCLHVFLTSALDFADSRAVRDSLGTRPASAKSLDEAEYNEWVRKG